MKRWPLVASFLLFIALCASAAYWAMQLFKPPVRPVAAPPQSARAEVRPEAAAALFGGRPGKVVMASNYQLRGVISSANGRDSVAILSADGKPAQAVRVNMEILPGVTVKEVHRDHVLLSEGGVTKRVELPESAKGQVNLASTAPMPRPQAPGTPMQPPPVPRVQAPGTPMQVTPAPAPAVPQAPAIAPGMPAVPGQTQPSPSQPGVPGAPGVQSPPSSPASPSSQFVPVPRSSVNGGPSSMSVNPPQAVPSPAPTVPGGTPPATSGFANRGS